MADVFIHREKIEIVLRAISDKLIISMFYLLRATFSSIKRGL